MKNNFKVGDRVHFTTAGEKVFKIVSIDSTQIPYELESIDNLDETFFTIESNIKLIPTMKNIKDLGEKVAIQCKTQEEWDFVTKELGYKWEIAKFDIMGEDNCICTSDKQHSSVLYYTQRGYTIHQASDFMPLSPQDEIKELKARIATLEESLRPKKKIEFVKACNRHKDNLGLNNPQSEPKEWEHIELICKATSINYYDVMFGYDKNRNEGVVFLGYFNDGIK